LDLIYSNFEKQNDMKKISKFIVLLLISSFFIACQSMDHPVLGDYPQDANPAGGPLKFYVAFDGTSDDVLKNAVDSIRANFATMNTTTPIDGVSGKAIEGGVGKFVTYAKPNDFAVYANSFTISFWEKHDGQTKNNALMNGPEYPFSFVSPASYHWSSSNFFLLFEGNNTACAVKFVIASGVNSSGASTADTWLTWEGPNSIPGLLDNQWHHCVFVYDETTSGLTFYLDNKVIGTKTWAGHGALGLANDKINSVRIGCGPQGNASDVSDNWLASTWKGGLDQFRMYATALTPAEIAELYSARK
jgi:hypothetical protein